MSQVITLNHIFSVTGEVLTEITGYLPVYAVCVPTVIDEVNWARCEYDIHCEQSGARLITGRLNALNLAYHHTIAVKPAILIAKD